MSNQAIINWRNFSINAGQLTKFVQPSSMSSVLNRVVSGDPSSIYGTLQANGRVFLINPNGITIGPTGVINAQSFIASTFDPGNQQFLAGGNLVFTGSSLAGLVNKGTINALGGDVALIAHTVDNSGTINAANGDAALAAGSEVLFNSGGDQRVFVEAGSGQAAVGVNQEGQIDAAAAELAAAGGNVYGLAINNSGVVRATAEQNVGGKIFLTAGDGSVSNSGTLKATNGDQGGAVQVTGGDITLRSGSVIDVSGRNVGGTALIGGDEHGTNPNVPDAKTVTVEAGATVNADATDNGNGGKVVVWSNNDTDFEGAISARGGPNGGNGGFAEVSGGILNFNGSVDTRAPKGVIGTLLLDPESMTIEDNSGTCVNIIGCTPTASQFSIAGTVGATTSILDTSVLDAELNSSSVLVTTMPSPSDHDSGTGDIIINSPITWTGANSLDLQAFGNISVNANISGGGGILMTAGGNSPSLGTITLAANVFTSSGLQTYASPVVIANGANVDLQANGYSTTSGTGGQIQFQYTVDGPGSLSMAPTYDSIHSGGGAGVQFTGAVGGGTPLGGMSISSGNGIIDFQDGGVASTGSQFYNGPVLVDVPGADATFSATTAGSVIAFEKTLDANNRSISISAPGIVSLDGAVGTDAVVGTTVGASFVDQLTVTSAGGISLSGGTYSIGPNPSTGGTPLVFSGPVQLGANTTITSHGSIDFTSTIAGNGFSLSTNSTDVTTFGGSISNLSSFDATAELAPGFINQKQINLGGSVGASGNIDFHSPVVLTGDSTLSAGGSIGFDFPLTGTFNLTTISGNGTTFNTLGTLASLNATDTSANGINLDQGTITTTGAQSYTGIVNCAICSLTSSGNTFNAGGAFSFNGTYNNVSLNVSGTSIGLAGSITTATDQTYTGPINLLGDATLTASGGALTFNNAISGAHNLTTSSSGVTTFTGVGTLSTFLTSLTSTASAFHLNGGVIGVHDDIAFNAPVTLGGNLQISTNGALTFGSTIDGAFNLIAGSGGATTLSGPIGFSSHLADLLVDAGGGVNLNAGTVTTTGGQSYGLSPILLGADTTLTGSVLFLTGTVDSASGSHHDLTINSGTVLMDGNVGETTPLGTLSVTAFEVDMEGDVITNGSQSYSNNVVLFGNGSINPGPSNTLIAGGTISIGGKVDGPTNFYPNSFGGPLTISGDIGVGTPLLSFNPSANAVTLGGDVITSASQSYPIPVTLLGNGSTNGAGTDTFTSSAGDVQFANSISGASLYINSAGIVSLSGNNSLSGLNINAPGNVSLFGSDFISGALNINTPGNVTLSITLGSFGSPVGSVNVTGSAISIAGDVLTNGNQTYNGPVTLGGSGSLNAGPSNTLFSFSPSGSIDFNGTVDGTTNLFMTDSPGGITFGGNVGSTTPLVSINAVGFSGTGITIAGDVTVTGNPNEGGQTYIGNVTLLGLGTIHGFGSNTLNSGADNVQIAGSVNGASVLTVQAGTNIQFNGDVGSLATPLTSLTATAPSGISVRSVYTTGDQIYGGPLTVLSNPSTFNSTSGSITFGSTIDGGFGTTALDATASGTIAFDGAVGSNEALDSLSASAPGGIAINGGVVQTSSGGQTYNGALTLDSDVAMSAGGPILFEQTVDGAHGLSAVSTGGDITILGAVGGMQPLSSLNLTAPAGSIIGIGGGSVQTTGNQFYVGSTVIGNSDATFDSSNGTIEFQGTLDTFAADSNDRGLTVQAPSGSAFFDGEVGSNRPLKYLDVDASGVAINGGLVRTSGSDGTNGQSYTGTLAINTLGTGPTTTTFDTTNAGANAGNNIAFNGEIEDGTAGADSVVVNAGTSGITFGASVGNGSALGALSVAAGVITLNGLVNTSAGTVPFSPSSTINAPLTTVSDVNNLSLLLDVANVTLNNNVSHTGSDTAPPTFIDWSGPTSLTLNSTGNITLISDIANRGSGSFTLVSGAGGGAGVINLNAGSMSVGGNEAYDGPVVLGSDIFMTAGGNIDFARTIDSPGHFGLETIASGNTVFGGAVGAQGTLGQLDVTANAGIQLNGGSVFTIDTGSRPDDGTQVYESPVVLGADTLLVASGNVATPSGGPNTQVAQSADTNSGGDILFASTVDSSSSGSNHYGLATVTADGAGFIGAVGSHNTLGFNIGCAFTQCVFNFPDATNDYYITDPAGNTYVTAPISSAGTLALGTGATPSGTAGTADKIVIGANITSSGDQTYSDDVVLAGNESLTTGGNITFNNGLYGNQTLSITATGTATFNTTVGARGGTLGPDPLIGLNLNAGSTVFNGGLTTSGNQTYTGTFTLTSDMTLESTNGAIDFEGPVVSALGQGYGLTTISAGDTTFGDTVGEIGFNQNYALGRLDVTTTGPGSVIHINGGKVVTVDTNVTNNPNDNGDQNYHSPVVLGMDTTLNALGSGEGSINFASTVDSSKTGASTNGNGLTIFADGSTTFGGRVGYQAPLGLLDVTAVGGINLNGSSIATQDVNPSGADNGDQNYRSPVVLGTDTMLVALTGDPSSSDSNGGSNITFSSTLDSSSSGSGSNDYGLAIVSAGNGGSFGGTIGGTHAVGFTSLCLIGSGCSYNNAGDYSYYTDSGSNIYVTDAINSNNSVQLNANGGGFIFLNGNVTSAQGQSYNGIVGLIGPDTFSSSGGNTIQFSGSLFGNENLTINASGGSVTFEQIAGLPAFGVNTTANDMVQALVINAPTISLAGAGLGGVTIQTSGDQFYNGAVQLTSDVSLLSGGAIHFGSTVDSILSGPTTTGYGLTTSSNGNTTFNGVVGGTGALGLLNVSTTGGGSIVNLNAGSVNTTSLYVINGNTSGDTGSQIYNSPVVLGANTTLAAAGAGNITFNSTVDADSAANNRTLNVEAAGTASFNGVVGSNQHLQSLTVDVSNPNATIGLGGSITTQGGGQSYDAPMLVTNNATLVDTAANGAGAISFANTLDDSSGSDNLTINSGPGGVNFGGTVGGLQTFAGLTVNSDGGSIQFNGIGDGTGTNANGGFNGSLWYGPSTLLNTTNGGNTTGAVTFVGSVDDFLHAGDSLSVTSGSGGVTFSGAVGYNSFLYYQAGNPYPTTLGTLTVKTDGGPIAFNGNDPTGASLWTNGTTVLDATNGGNFVGNLATPLGAVSFLAGISDLGFFNASSNSLTITSGAGGVTFGGAVGFDAPPLLTVYGSGGNIAFNGTGNGISGFGSLTLGANGSPSVTTIDTTQNGFGGAYTTGSVTFAGSVDDFYGGDSLIVTAGSGGVAFNEQVGFNVAPHQLTVNSAGPITLGHAATDPNMAVFTGGNGQQYNGPVILGANTMLNEGSIGNIAFSSTVDADLASNDRTLDVEAGGIASFNDKVGAGQALQSLTVDGSNTSGIFTLGNSATDPTMSVTTRGGGQTYGVHVLGFETRMFLGANTTLSDTGSGDITINSTVDADLATNNRTLDVETAGITAFNDAVGGLGFGVPGQALQSLTVDASHPTGSIVLGDAGLDPFMSITTQGGGQSYGAPVVVGANTTLADTGGAIAFASTLNDQTIMTDNLTINSGPSGATFTGTVGGIDPLANLTVTSSGGDIAFNGTGDGTTQVNGTWTGSLWVGGSGAGKVILDTTNGGSFNTGEVTFAGSVDDWNGGNSLAVTAGSGGVAFNGAVGYNAVIGNAGALGSLSVTTDSGNIAFNGIAPTGGSTLWIGAPTTVDSTNAGQFAGAPVTFTGAIGDAKSFGGISHGDPLTISAGTGGVTFDDVVGYNSTLGQLTVNGTGSITLGSATPPSGSPMQVNTYSGGQHYAGPVTLAANTTFSDASGGSITLNSTADADLASHNRTLDVETAGTATFGGAVGGNQALQTLTVDGTIPGGAIELNGNVTTKGDQDYAGSVVILNAPVTLTASTIELPAVAGGGNDLTLDNSGSATLNEVVNGVGMLTANGTGTLTTLNALLPVSLADHEVTSLGGSVITSGDQDYSATVSLSALVVLQSSTVELAAVNGNTNNLTLVNNGLATLSGAVNNVGVFNVVGGGPLQTDSTLSAASFLDNETTTLGGSVTTSGGQQYNGALSLSANATFTSTTLGMSNNLTGNNHNLTLTNSGSALFVQPTFSLGTGVLTVNGAGTLTRIGNLSAGSIIDGESTTLINGTATTTGSQTYNGVLTPSGPVELLTTTASGNITLNQAVTGSGAPFEADAAGNVLLNGAVSGTALTTLIAGGQVKWNAPMSAIQFDIMANNNIVMNGALTSANGVLMVAGNAFDNAGNDTITLTGGNWLIYSFAAFFDTPGSNLLQAMTPQQFNSPYPTAPTFVGSGFLYATSPGFGTSSLADFDLFDVFAANSSDWGVLGPQLFGGDLILPTPDWTDLYKSMHEHDLQNDDNLQTNLGGAIDLASRR